MKITLDIPDKIIEIINESIEHWETETDKHPNEKKPTIEGELLACIKEDFLGTGYCFKKDFE